MSVTKLLMRFPNIRFAFTNKLLTANTSGKQTVLVAESFIAGTARAVARKSNREPPTSKHPSVDTLSREQFQQWDDLVSKSPHGTVFHYSWWLEAVGTEFKILGCWDENGKLVGGIPLPFKKKAGFVLYHSPTLAPYLGPIFDLRPTDDAADSLYRVRFHGEQLARAIDGFDSLSYIAGAAAPDLQGFLWAGFRACLTYTFRFRAGTTVDQALKKVSRGHRQKLKKAAEYSIEVGNSVDALAVLAAQTFARQGIKYPYTENGLRGIWHEACKRGRANLYTASGASGLPVAALLVVNDDRTSYEIVSGIDRTDSAVGALLTWRAICDALNAGRTFDFEGSRLRGVAEHYRRWGGQACPMWHLSKTGKSFRGLMLRSALRTLGPIK